MSHTDDEIFSKQEVFFFAGNEIVGCAWYMSGPARMLHIVRHSDGDSRYLTCRDKLRSVQPHPAFSSQA